MPFLELNGTVRELTPGEITIGSGAQADWRVPSHDLAARHFIVSVDEGGSARVRPCSQQNVVVVNRQQLGPRPLAISPGDEITAGNARFRVLDGPEAPEEAEPFVLRADPAHLVDESEATAYPLRKRSVAIGRDSASAVRLKDPSASRFHADVRVEAGEHVLYTLGSTGTQVNGERITTPRVLREGDRITIADTVLRYTTGELPSGVEVRAQQEEPEDTLSRRRTMTMNTPVAGSHKPYEERSIMPWLLLIAAIAIAALAYVLIFHGN